MAAKTVSVSGSDSPATDQTLTQIGLFPKRRIGRPRRIRGDNPGYKPVDISGLSVPSTPCIRFISEKCDCILRNATSVLVAARRVPADEEIVAPAAVQAQPTLVVVGQIICV